MPEQTNLKKVLDAGEQLFRLCRDLALGALLGLLVLFPGFLRTRLQNAGITKFESNGVTWEAQAHEADVQTRAAATTVSNATEALQTVNQQLTQASAEARDPKVKLALADSITGIAKTLGQVAEADSSLKNSVLAQQELLLRANPQAAPVTARGWLYLGEIDPSKAHWSAGSPKNIQYAPWPLTIGQVIRVAGSNYLRADSTGQHSQAPVSSAIQDKTRVRSEDIDPVHAMDSSLTPGWFLWVKVSGVTEGD